MKRKINNIVIHCTGANQNQSVQSILNYWKNTLGWKNVGYHRLIDKYGNIHNLSDFNQVTNGVKGHNSNSIHICYIGGEFEDNRTELQKAGILECIYEALRWVDNPNKIEIKGHRDFKGVTKSCPQFDAKKEYEWITA